MCKIYTNLAEFGYKGTSIFWYMQIFTQKSGNFPTNVSCAGTYRLSYSYLKNSQTNF